MSPIRFADGLSHEFGAVLIQTNPPVEWVPLAFRRRRWSMLGVL
jgi:hypothetical protein